LGASASFLGQALLQNSEILRIVAGIIIIIFSFQLLGIINISYLNFEKRFDAKESRNILFPYIIGLAFGFGWTPCIGPILGSILAIASIEETLTRAIILLIFYSLGLAIPFVLSGYLIQKFLLFSKNFRKNINLISKIGGITLLATGILILTNQLQAIGFYIIKVFPFMQNFG
jgi:cytochrome c-type biogenesis protein